MYTYKIRSEAELKEFERRLKYKPRLKYGWFHLKFHIQATALLKPVFGGFKTRLKFIKFEQWIQDVERLFYMSYLDCRDAA